MVTTSHAKAKLYFLSHGMYAPVHGEYILFHGNLNELYFMNG
jgi:hypothetical protein